MSENYLRNAAGERIRVGIREAGTRTVTVTSEPYGAKGDGLTNDRPALQKAIDDMHAAGGGAVVVPGGHTYLTGDVEVKSNVTLHLCPGAVVKQSKNPEHYAHRPEYGIEHDTGLIWDGKYHSNYPLVFAGSGTSNVRITGGGTLELDYSSPLDEENLFMSIIGFFAVEDFEISDIHLKHTHGYNIALRKCRNGIIRGVTISDPERGAPDGWSTDGISLQNCQNMRITGCNITSSDDLIYIWTSYRDPRGRTWWHSQDPQPSRNIEVDHNTCTMIRRSLPDACHGFAILPWGGTCPDLNRLEVSQVYVHDNVFSAPHPIGSIGPDVYHSTDRLPPARDIRFVNNILLPQGSDKGVWLESLSIENLTFE